MDSLGVNNFMEQILDHDKENTASGVLKNMCCINTYSMADSAGHEEHAG